MMRALRIALAVLCGFVAWFVVATLANWVVRAGIPGYAEAEPAAHFTLSMLFARLAVGAVSSLIAGFTCAWLAGADRTAVRLFAVLLVLFFLPVHYALWATFPVWYHALFLASLAPLVWAGSRIARYRGRTIGAA